MASLIEDLLHTLEETTGCYEKLLEVANNKKEVIIKGDVPSLQTMTKSEQELAGRLSRLEKKRQETVKDICLVTNKEYENFKIRELVALLQGQPEESGKLQKATDQLIEIIRKVKEVNDENALLIRESLDYVEFTLNAINSANQGVTHNNYESKGKQQYNNDLQNGLFDAKQ